MANQITGKILYIYPAETIVGKSGNGITKRAILIDCTRFDPYTGERGFENTPLLEFIGEKCNELNSYQPGQVVTITFDVQGTRYTNKDGVENVFTRVQPYKIELKQIRQQNAQPTSYQPAPAQPAQLQYQQPVQQPEQQFPPRVDRNGLPF